MYIFPRCISPLDFVCINHYDKTHRRKSKKKNQKERTSKNQIFYGLVIAIISTYMFNR